MGLGTRESRGSLLGLGAPGSLTVVCGVGHSRESHGSLLQLGTPGSLAVVCGVGHSRR